MAHDETPEVGPTIEGRVSMVEERDARFRELERRAREAFAAGQSGLVVDPRGMLEVLATMNAYWEMAGLDGRRPRTR